MTTVSVKHVLIFAGGFALGSVTSIVALKGYFQRAFDQELKDERELLAHMRERFRDRATGKASVAASEGPRSDSMGKSKIDGLDGPTGASEGLRSGPRVGPLVRNEGTTRVDISKETVDEVTDDDYAAMVADNMDLYALRAAYANKGTYLITEEEFCDNPFQYDVFNFYFFAEDETLCDDQEEILQEQDWLGAVPQWRKRAEEGDSAIYVVDHTHQRIIEVLVTMGSYQIFHGDMPAIEDDEG